MAAINMGGVIKGGLAAGLMLNIGETILHVFVISSSMEAELAARNLLPVGGSAIAGFVVLCFALGLAMVWLYAAVRPRLGPGPKTAMCVGSLVWALSYLWSSIGTGLMGVFSWNILIIGLVWGLVEVLLAAYVGAYLYSE